MSPVASVSATALVSQYSTPERPSMLAAVDRDENVNPSEYCLLHSTSQTEDALLPLLLRTTALGQSRGAASLKSQSLRQALGTTAAVGSHVVISASFVLEPLSPAATSTANRMSAGTRCPAHLQSNCPAQVRQAGSAYAEPAAHNPGQDSGHCSHLPYDQEDDTFCSAVLDQAHQAPVDALWLERIMSVSAIILGDNTLGCAAESATLSPDISPHRMALVGEMRAQPCSWTLRRPLCPPPSSPVLFANNSDQDPADTLWLERVMSVSAIILGEDTLDSAAAAASSDLDE
jgi:hypothetical protein